MKLKLSSEKWLYHPGLVNPHKGFTGFYRPAGVDKNGIHLIEVQQIIDKDLIEQNPEEKEIQ